MKVPTISKRRHNASFSLPNSLDHRRRDLHFQTTLANTGFAKRNPPCLVSFIFFRNDNSAVPIRVYHVSENGLSMRCLVPATSANLGPGFDCLGLALALYNEIELREIDHGLEFDIQGEGATELPLFNTIFVVFGAQVTMVSAGHMPRGLFIRS